MSDEKNAYHHKRLKVWQKAMQLVVDVYEITQRFPQEEQFGLTSQIRRCAVSIPSNIAEGHGRGSNKELIRFLNIARGSVFELDTQLEIARQVRLLSRDQFDYLGKLLDEISVKIEDQTILKGLIQNSDYSIRKVLYNKFENDIFGLGEAEKTSYKNLPCGSDGNTLFFIVEPIDVKSRLEKIRNTYSGKAWEEFYSQHKKWVDIFDSLSIESNPLLVQVQLNVD